MNVYTYCYMILKLLKYVLAYNNDIHTLIILNYLVMSIHYVPGTGNSTLHSFYHLIFKVVLSHYTDEGTKIEELSQITFVSWK